MLIGDYFGKTALIYHCAKGQELNSRPEFSIKEILIDNTEVTLQIWDRVEQFESHSEGYPFYKEIDCCVLAYDMTCMESFENLDKWRRGFLENAKPDDSSSFPFILLGKKVDNL